MVIAVAITLGVVGLTGCSTASSPAAVPTKAPKATTPATAGPTTKAPAPGSIAVAGFKPASVTKAVDFVEKFVMSAMSTCDPAALPILESRMTPDLYQAEVKSSSHVLLTFAPPTVMSPDCVTSQDLSDESVGAGLPVKGVPTIRVAVTVTEGLKVGTTTSPKSLKPITVSRRYTVDVRPYGKDWQASRVKTSNSTVTSGK